MTAVETWRQTPVSDTGWKTTGLAIDIYVCRGGLRYRIAAAGRAYMGVTRVA